MAQRTLDITVAYAQDLKDVNLFTKMDVYVVVSISGGSSGSISKQKTSIDRDSGTHPTWNFPMKFTIDESEALQDRLTLVFKIKCDGNLSDSHIGEVRVPIKELLNASSAANGDAKTGKYVSYQVRKPSGRGQGMLTFSYKFGDKMAEAHPHPHIVEPVKWTAEAAARPAPVAAYPSVPPQPQPPQQAGPSPMSFLCVPNSQSSYRPSCYPVQTPEPYPYTYPPQPEQIIGSGCTAYPPPPTSYPYPPSPAQQVTGLGYNTYPPPPTPTPTPNHGYGYSPYHQQPQEHVNVYPPPPSASQGYVHPPQQPHSGYAPQPQSGGGYQQPQAYPGFGY